MKLIKGRNIQQDPLKICSLRFKVLLNLGVQMSDASIKHVWYLHKIFSGSKFNRIIGVINYKQGKILKDLWRNMF